MKYIKEYYNTENIEDFLKDTFIDYNPWVYFNNSLCKDGERFFMKNNFTVLIKKIRIKDIIDELMSSISYMSSNNYTLSAVEAETSRGNFIQIDPNKYQDPYSVKKDWKITYIHYKEVRIVFKEN